MPAYYNEIDPKKAAWLRELMRCGLIAGGAVDERSIADVRAADLAGFTQCHFFAGIGAWSYALRLAGWSDDAPVWTGSCPCQPFSVAGKGDGTADARHLWPEWSRLIFESRPPVVFGEQVASKPGLAWLDLVHADLEGAGYAVGTADLCAAGVGAPHIRQRLYFVADAGWIGREPGRFDMGAAPRGDEGETWQRERIRAELTTSREPLVVADSTSKRYDRGRTGEACKGAQQSERSRVAGVVADPARRGLGVDGSAPGGGGHTDQRDPASLMDDAIGPRLEGHCGNGDNGHEPGRVDAGAPRPASATGAVGGLAYHDETGRGELGRQRLSDDEEPPCRHNPDGCGESDGFWDACDWLPCRDGKARPVEPGTFPLAHGAPARVVRLRGYGDGIVAPLAAAFIEAYRDTKGMTP